jgi:arginase
MAAAASLPVPYPEVAVIEEGSLEEQSLALAASLPERPFVLGGCCCAHVGTVEGLRSKLDRITLIWLDAHGDLNTPESSPSGNAWGMPLRMLVDAEVVRQDDVALVGARKLDPPEQELLSGSGIHVGVEGVKAALEGTAGAYVALDGDVLDAREVAAFMPEPGGWPLGEVEELLCEVAARTTIVGAGVTGLVADARNVGPLERLSGSLGFRA